MERNFVLLTFKNNKLEDKYLRKQFFPQYILRNLIINILTLLNFFSRTIALILTTDFSLKDYQNFIVNLPKIITTILQLLLFSIVVIINIYVYFYSFFRKYDAKKNKRKSEDKTVKFTLEVPWNRFFEILSNTSWGLYIFLSIIPFKITSITEMEVNFAMIFAFMLGIRPRFSRNIVISILIFIYSVCVFFVYSVYFFDWYKAYIIDVLSMFFCLFTGTLLNWVIENNNRELFSSKMENSKKKQQVIVEHEKSRKLLGNILPNHYVTQFTADESSSFCVKVRENLTNVITFISDFVGFTHFCKQRNAKEIVEALNIYYLKFDSISKKYGIERITTIGDAFLCAIIDSEDLSFDHVKMCSFALSLLEFVEKMSEKGKLKVRVGISSNTCYSVVFGSYKTRLSYDLIGISRMESEFLEENAPIMGILVNEVIHNATKKEFLYSKNEMDLRIYSHHLLGNIKGFLLLKILDCENLQASVNRDISKLSTSPSMLSIINDASDHEESSEEVLYEKSIEQIKSLDDDMSIIETLHISTKSNNGEDLVFKNNLNWKEKIFLTFCSSKKRFKFLKLQLSQSIRLYRIIGVSGLFFYIALMSTYLIYVNFIFVEEHAYSILFLEIGLTIIQIFLVVILFLPGKGKFMVFVKTFSYLGFLFLSFITTIFLVTVDHIYGQLLIFVVFNWITCVLIVDIFLNVYIRAILIIVFTLVIDAILFIVFPLSKEGKIENGKLWPTLATEGLYILFCFVIMVQRTRNSMKLYIQNEFISKKVNLIKDKQKKNNNLLNSVLPISLSERVKKSFNPCSLIEKVFGTVCFVEIEKFYKYFFVNKNESIEFLDKLFTKFNYLCQKYDCYRIKSVGNIYIVVTGLKKEENHTEKIIKLSNKFIKHTEKIKKSESEVGGGSYQSIGCKVGLATGEYIAGVVGTVKYKFHHDIFGQIINLASRLCDISEKSKINASEYTIEHLKKHGKIKFYENEKRNNIHIKGIGRCSSYWIREKFS